jgi:hypothetical protein
LSVTRLPWAGTPESLLSNVNRWRGQLQLPPAGATELAEFTRQLKAGDTTVTVVDLRGRFSAGSMTAPFATGADRPAAEQAAPGAPGTAPTAAPSEPGAAKGDLPPGHPPIEASQPPASAPPNSPANDTPKFDTPEGWQPLPASGMRKAAFAIGTEQEGGLVTVINFRADAGPMIADPLQNVNRWRREVGLEPLEQAQLANATETIKVDGETGTYVRLVPDAAQPEQSKSAKATLAAMVTHGDQLWFVKLTGNRPVVVAQEEAFKSFLTSFRFAGDDGAVDVDK